MSRFSRSAALLLCLLGCHVWKAVTKTLHERRAQEVTLKVHVSDSTTHQPLGKVFIEIFTNQTSFASEYSKADGIAFISFQYTLEAQLFIIATKRGYVPNSSPWRATKLPLFSSVSLLLHPERSATLMVYDDIVQIVSGFQGTLIQPKIQFQRRSLNLPKNLTYRDLIAFLTVAVTPWEVGGFPHLQGIDVNQTGNSSSFELSPVTGVSVHLLNSDGTEIQVNGPICVTIPLPASSPLKHGDTIPAWKLDMKIGAWLHSGLGIVQKEGDSLTWTYFAPQLGYWIAAMSPQSPGNLGGFGARDITVYHTVFLLAILGGMTIILLVLLCLLIYYCRRKCLKPRLHHRKIQLSSALDISKKDQATSMSPLNLISAVHMELVSNGEADVHTPMLKPLYSTSREFSSREELISHRDPTLRDALKDNYCRSPRSYRLKMARSIDISEDLESPVREEYRKSYNSVVSQPLLDKRDKEVQASMSLFTTDSKSSIRAPDYQLSYVPDKAQNTDRKATDYMMSRSVDHLERPTAFPQPGQLLCCSSADEVNDNVYRKVLPTLVIPAHYMKLPMEYGSTGQPLTAPTEQQVELERLQADLSLSHQQLHPHSQQQQVAAQALSQQQLQEAEGEDWSPQSSAMSESVSIPATLTEAAMAQMNGEVQLFTEKALLELAGGKPLPHPRAWFVSLDGRANAQVRHSYIDLQKAGKNGSNDASLDSGVDMNESKPIRKGKEARERNLSGSVTYTRLVYVDDMEQSGSESGTAVCSPEDASMKPLEGSAEEGQSSTTKCLQNENIQRIEEIEACLPSTPKHTDDQMINIENDRINDNDQINENDDNDSTDQDEDKKSPWQKREERPLIAFNLK
ncbi:protein FAM171A1 isoform X1 [Hypanus sabinus]|uniref:protein FAM171A1 isoform X1 n=2 Tax=Hypanus sabinus TaxID=79690 RepID=UPI0028C3808E|nr:protein FAM171A1 isoform X1 [Hypanus sabinus]